MFDIKDSSIESVARLCSSRNHQITVSTSNRALIRMKSSSEVSGRGFLLKYSINCNRTIESDSGVIESPNFPNIYPNNMKCSWKIVVSKGNKINMQFSEFELDANNETEAEVKK